jgi:hypothetical protein
MDLLERAPLLDELDGVLAATTTGGRIVLLAGEAGLEREQLSSASRGSVWRALIHAIEGPRQVVHHEASHHKP